MIANALEIGCFIVGLQMRQIPLKIRKQQQQIRNRHTSLKMKAIDGQDRPGRKIEAKFISEGSKIEAKWLTTLE
jgi:hypothetical protein